MPGQSGTGIVRRYYDDALTPGNWSALDELVASDFVDHEVLYGIPATRAGLRQKYELLRGGFPDLRFDVEDLLMDEDKVAARVMVSGTHSRAFLGQPPTGQHFSVMSLNIFRVRNGQITEHWGVFDQMGMLTQLRVFPAFARR